MFSSLTVRFYALLPATFEQLQKIACNHFATGHKKATPKGG